MIVKTAAKSNTESSLTQAATHYKLCLNAGTNTSRQRVRVVSDYA